MKKFLLLLLLITFFSASGSFCQTKNVSGRLTDNNGEPLPGVNITIKVLPSVR